MIRPLAIVSMLGALLAGCPAAPTSSSTQTKPRAIDPTPDSRPRLVVVVVVDQFPEWSFERKRTALTGGFARLLAEGEWRVGHHPSGATITASGHALIGTGETPSKSGILANEWWSRDQDRAVKAVEPDDQTKWLRVPGLGDAIAATNTPASIDATKSPAARTPKPAAKAVAVALKDRAARLLLGHRGLAVWYDASTGTWASSGDAVGKFAHEPVHPVTTAESAATDPRPPWIRAMTPPSKRLAPWTPLDADRLAKLSGVADAQPGEVGEKGFGPTFPHEPTTVAKYNDAVFALPLGNEVVLDAALAAIDGENLGADHVPDLLFVSLSAHDYIAHGWGHESWEAWDSELRLDAQLDHFLAELDRRVGEGRWAMILTSDHGGAPMPETNGGGRYTVEQIKSAANLAATTVLGTGNWIANAQYPYVYLSKAALAQPRSELKNALKKIVFALKSFPGLGVADRTDAFAGRCDERTGDAKALCLMIDPERAGDFIYLPGPGWIMEEEDERLATAHGSLNDYDREVPVLLLPWGRTKHAPADAPGEKIDLGELAPLIASWLGVPSPTTLTR
ncbi:MAG: hypothetical protein HOV81_23270 [Kofleriaceae bacterium]|nr:hypothetical protein [Kofleriaceae bacterium]